MNPTLQFILETMTVLIFGIILNWIGTTINKKYRLNERKIVLKVFFLFLFGLLFVVESLIFLISDISAGSLTWIKGVLYVTGLLIGALLLALLVRLVVVQNDEPRVDTGPFYSVLPARRDVKRRIPSTFNRNRFWGWVFTFSGLLLTVACIYLFLAYGPQHDPPGMSAEHQQMDLVINYVCGSVAIGGLVITGIGIRKLRQLIRAPQ